MVCKCFVQKLRLTARHQGLNMQVDIYITPGAHSTEAAVNKQLNDKERVAAALENPNLLDMVNKCLIST